MMFWTRFNLCNGVYCKKNTC